MKVLAITVAVLGIASCTAAIACWRQRKSTLDAIQEARETGKRLSAARSLIKILQGRPISASVKQGKGGRWRWEVDNAQGKFVAGAPPQGYKTRADAVNAVKLLFPGRIGGL